jgi:hypothetical protein
MMLLVAAGAAILITSVWADLTHDDGDHRGGDGYE